RSLNLSLQHEVAMLRPGECPETWASGGQRDTVSAPSYRTPLRTLLDTSAAVQQMGDFCRFLHGLRRKNVLSIRASTAQPAPVAPRAGCAPGAQRRRPGSWSLTLARATMLGGGRRGPWRLWLLVSRREYGLR